MDSSDLKTWQTERIHNRITPTLGYLNRLRDRMEQLGFPAEDDTLYRLVENACDALHALNVETHYLSCGSGVARESRE
jgi:hypothetical protein